MHSFMYEGVEYRSLHEFCKEKHVSWQKMRRLCRHYERARKDPAVAADWMLAEREGTVNLEKEPRTMQYRQDLERNRERQETFRERVVQRILES